MKFPLRGESLIPGERDGISNEVIADPVEIKVGEGSLLLCMQLVPGSDTDSIEVESLI